MNTYFDILLHNSLSTTQEGNKYDREKLSTAFDDIISVYEQLFSFSLSISGFQFIGLSVQQDTPDNFANQMAVFILSYGFLLSMFSALLCFIVIEFMRGCRDENDDFIDASIQSYKGIFKLPDKILYVDCILFVVPINIMIYNTVEKAFGIIYNVSSVILFIVGLYLHYKIIMRKQTFGNVSRKIYKIK